MQIYYILAIEKVWHATIPAVSALNLVFPKLTFLKFSSLQLSTSFSVKSPSGPIKIKESDLGFINLNKGFFAESLQCAINKLSFKK